MQSCACFNTSTRYEPDSYEAAFSVTTVQTYKKRATTHTIILRAPTIEEMHHWLNSLVVQRVAIEESIDSITLNLTLP